MLQSNLITSETQSFHPLAQGESEEARQSLAAPMLLQYWQVVLRWKWVILGIILSSLAIGLVATLLMTPKYTATSRIEISREQKNITKVEGLDSGDAGRDLEFYQTQYSLLSARSVAERVSRTLHLSSNESFFQGNGIKTTSNTMFSDTSNRPLTAAERDKREQLAVQLLIKNIAIAPVRGSSLIDIKYTSGSPNLSAQIANTWTQQFIQSSMDRRFASDRKSVV